MAISPRHKGAPWLLLAFSLPSRRASQRVQVWRKLQRFGAIPFGNSGYLLPHQPANRERFEWLAATIRKYRGEASVVEVRSIDNLSASHIAGRFAEARARDYRQLIRELNRMRARAPSRSSAARLSGLRKRFQQIAEIDFFRSPLRARVEDLFDGLDTARATPPPAGRGDAVVRKEHRNRLWVTRPRPGVDRVFSAWLIRRFIDPNARFAFADEKHVPRKAVAFDMYHGGFGHRGKDCTFETLLKQFRIRDRRASVLAQIVHDADLFDDKFGRKEGYGIDEVLKGWGRTRLSDKEILRRGLTLVDGLYLALR